MNRTVGVTALLTWVFAASVAWAQALPTAKPEEVGL